MRVEYPIQLDSSGTNYCCIILEKWYKFSEAATSEATSQFGTSTAPQN